MWFGVIGALALLAWSSSPASAERLPRTVVPSHYDLAFVVDLERARFEGTETVRVQIGQPTSRIVLNAAEIEFRTVTIGSGATAQQATVMLDATSETATLTVPRPLPRGPAEIRLTYTGTLNDKLRGFYLSTANNRNYAITQFEATDARRAFPCFDEPDFKATFAVTLTIARGDTAVSNGRIISDTPGPGPAQHTLKFSTSPKMSSYLVAMAVGDFECLQATTDNIPIRICATPDKKDLGRIALESAQQILAFYNRYFAIAYPFGKLDVLAAPDFAAGAMENTASIFYRETDLLADSRTASLATRKTIASVLAHEMAHQWFGDLVTMRWWNDLWLNEGFATWMANRPLAAWKPEWNIAVDEGLENQTAFNLDSLRTTHSVRATITTTAQIEESFDPIAYEKGGAVLRMIENYVGADTFRRGINAYLRAHAYGNATSEDFWRSMAAVSGKPVDRILPTFLQQPGAPLISLSLSCSARGQTSVILRQQRFVLDGEPTAQDAPSRWQVPVCLKASGQTSATCTMLRDPVQTVTLRTSTCAPWVFANAGAQGYYRAEHPPEMLRAMAPRIATDLTAAERLALLNDEWALVQAGRHDAGAFLTIAAGFGREVSSGVLGQVADRLAFVREYLTTDAAREPFQAFTRSLLRPLYDGLGFSPLAGDTDERRALRGGAIMALGTTGDDRDVAQQARAALDRALAGGPALDPIVASAVVSVAAEHGDEKLHDALSGAAARASSPEERYLYLYAAGDFRDPALLDRGLRAALSPDIRSQDTVRYLSEFFANPVARPRAWSFVKANWPLLEPQVTVFFGDVRLARALGSFCDAGTRDDIRAFFAMHRLPSAARTLDQALERIDSCIALRQRQTQAVSSWLAAR
ncbi:MAG: M1 family metallopeptidase [Vicinamibacterales bacterium]